MNLGEFELKKKYQIKDPFMVFQTELILNPIIA
jgi:hypothetical protein